MVARGKAPGLNSGTSGNGTLSHLAIELFNARTGTGTYAFHGGGGTDTLTGTDTGHVWTITAEVFGQAGTRQEDVPALTQPRFQAGLRWRPIDRWNIDVIYGRNLTGENASWITIATILRFPPNGR